MSACFKDQPTGFLALFVSGGGLIFFLELNFRLDWTTTAGQPNSACSCSATSSVAEGGADKDASGLALVVHGSKTGSGPGGRSKRTQIAW